MTTLTYFSDVAAQPAKVMPQHTLAQKFLATLDTTVASGTSVGLVAFQEGFSPVFFTVGGTHFSATSSTADVGYVYDSASLTDNTDEFFNDNTFVASGGSSIVWPTSTGSLNTLSPFRAEGSGYLTVTFNATTTVTGTLSGYAVFTYDIL